VLAQLTPDERSLCFWKQLGFSSRDIAREEGMSVARVTALFYRIRRGVRNALVERVQAHLRQEPRTAARHPRNNAPAVPCSNQIESARLSRSAQKTKSRNSSGREDGYDRQPRSSSKRRAASVRAKAAESDPCSATDVRSYSTTRPSTRASSRVIRLTTPLLVLERLPRISETIRLFEWTGPKANCPASGTVHASRNGLAVSAWEL
jgi:hypothetical protein